MPGMKDVTGLRFGMLVAVRVVGADEHKRKVWECRCDCGGSARVMIGNLTSGNSESCGCQKYKIKHGKYGTRVYRIWAHVLQRCNNPKYEAAYKHYGGRGIRVCERWHSFEAFHEDMGDPPPGTSIDRIDVNGNYEPSNCRWATPTQQMNNTRKTRYVTHEGQTLPVGEWSQRCGIPLPVLASRLFQCGWSTERAMNEPVNPVGGRRQIQRLSGEAGK